MLLPPACLSFILPVSPASLSVSQYSVDDSGHKGNTGQLLNSRVLGVLLVITLFMTQLVLVCQPQSKLHSVHPFLQGQVGVGGGGGVLSLQPNLKKGRLDRTTTFRGGC